MIPVENNFAPDELKMNPLDRLLDHLVLKQPKTCYHMCSQHVLPKIDTSDSESDAIIICIGIHSPST